MENKASTLIVLFALGARCLAQVPGWAGPSSGLVFDPPTKSIRRIDGFPGGAQLSGPILGDLKWFSIAPNGSRGLASAVSGEVSWLEGLDRADFSLFPIASISTPPIVARWRADSSAVRLYSSECACLLTFSLQLPGQPSQIGAAGFVDPSIGEIKDFYWSDSTTIFSTVKGLFRLDDGRPIAQLFPSEQDLTYFLEAKGKAWAFRSSKGQIFEVWRDAGREETLRLVTADTEGLTDVSAIASSEGMIWVADRKTRSLYQIAVDNGALTAKIELDSGPLKLTQLNGRRAWLIRERSEQGEPLLILEGAGTPQVFFVPGGEQQ